ncbi:MAG: phosphatase PAP2 family protein [Sulfurimonas sp.]|nr:phosphatase PAP2 family protein [Sulfurimonas sp.]
MQFNEKITLDERWLFTVLIIAMSAFIVLTFSMRNGHLAEFDQNVLHWFHKIKNRTLDNFFSSLTWLGSLWILLPLYLILILTLSHYFENVEKFLGIGFWGAFFTTYILKYRLDRKRPRFFSTINELPIDPSFPSAHTSQIVTFTLLFWLMVHNGSSLSDNLFTGVLLFIASGVALSRMYLQVHFPTDVIAGALIAIAWSCIAILVIKSGGLA